MPSKIFRDHVLHDFENQASHWREAQLFFATHFLNHQIALVTISHTGAVESTYVTFQKRHLQHLLGLSYKLGARKFWDDLASNELNKDKLDFSGISRLIKQSKQPVETEKLYSHRILNHHITIAKHYQSKMLAIPLLHQLLFQCDLSPDKNHHSDGLIFHTISNVALAFRTINNTTNDHVFISNLLLTFKDKKAVIHNAKRVVAIINLPTN